MYQDVSMEPVARSRDGATKVIDENREVKLWINEDERSLPGPELLLSSLRTELGLTGAKAGCEEGACGSCTVLVDGVPMRACEIKATDVVGRHVTTVEGLANPGRLHPVQRAFLDVGAMQCGYCTPGMVLAAAALLERNPDPDDDAITEALEGNICRCGAYGRIRLGVHRAAELSRRYPGVDFAIAAATSHGELLDPPDRDARVRNPWDLTPPEDRDYFEILGDGLVVVLPPPKEIPGVWSRGDAAWIHVNSDSKVTAFTGKVDIGQDNRTALRLLVAEELDLPLSDVVLVMGDTDLCPYDMGTFGSRSMPDAGGPLRRVSAYARNFLPVAAGVRRLEIIAGEVVVRPPTAWKTAGKGHFPEGAIAAVTGERKFITDYALPGMRHGAVLRPPVPGAKLLSLDSTSLVGRSDIEVVQTPQLVGIVAADPKVARAALGELKAQWDHVDLPSDDGVYDYLRTHPGVKPGDWARPYHYEVGDTDAALKGAKTRLDATYTTAYIAPASLEPRAALASWNRDGRLTILTGSQTPFPDRAQVAAALGIAQNRVRIIVAPTGGGFGGKHAGGVATEAAILAREVGGPVRVAWTRNEEFTVGTLRPAAVIDVSAAVSDAGGLSAWKFSNINSGAAGISAPYRIPNASIDYLPALSPLTQGAYRALAANANNFARESHIDELARQLGVDPVQFRLDNTDDERLATVLRTAARSFGWGSHAKGIGHGIAFGLEKDARVATAAKVELSRDGEIHIHRLLTVYECGALVNPETVRSQVEGATVMALGGALFEAIRFTKGRITNGSFREYRVPRFSDVPTIEVILLDRPDIEPAGAGETPMIAVAPALANAIFDATQQRLYSLPLIPQR